MGELFPSKGILQVGGPLLSQFLPRAGGWQDNTLPLTDGSLCLRTGRICPSIAVTQSDCRKCGGFHSRVEHDSSVAILAVGLQGTSLFGFDGETPHYDVRSGDVWLFRANDTAIVRHTPCQGRARMVAVKFAVDRIAELLDGGISGRETRALRLACGVDPDRLSPLVSSPLSSPIERLMAESFTLGILAEWLSPMPSLPQGEGPLSSHERRSLERVMDLLVSHLDEPPSLEYLATEAAMSHTRLNRCFHKAFGTTVFSWLREYRLDLARRHLLEGKHSVTDIAFLCGFCSSSHFASAFQRKYACSPTTFRQENAPTFAS